MSDRGCDNGCHGEGLIDGDREVMPYIDEQIRRRSAPSYISLIPSPQVVWLEPVAFMLRSDLPI